MSSSIGCEMVIEVRVHPDLKLGRQIVKGRRVDVEMWMVVVTSGANITWW